MSLLPVTNRPPDFSQFLRVLRRQKPDRPVLFEHYIEWPLIFEALGDEAVPNDDPPWGWVINIARAYARLGFDTAPLYFCQLKEVNFRFADPAEARAESISQNERAVISDASGLAHFAWPDPEEVPFQRLLDHIADSVPQGMKLLLYPPRGVLESLVDLVGFDNLCFALYDDPDFVEALCMEIGSRIRRYFERGLNHEIIGGMFVSDDFGFKTSTLIAPGLLRRFILPWHKQFVGEARKLGKPAILHSCGQVDSVMEDIIQDIGYAAKHSFEDVICPVEEIYAQYGSRIGILGGFDVDYLSRSSPDAIYQRAKKMLELADSQHGGYALGSGNSLTAEMPRENVAALLSAAGA